MEVLHRRARILRASVTAAVLCALLAAVLVLLLFSSAVFGMRLDLPALAIFAGSLLSLIVSLALFIFDLNLALRAMQDELLR